MTTRAAVWVAQDYRFRNDDGTLATATWRANENTAATIPLAGKFRLRVNVGETNNANSANVTAWKLQFRVGSGSWTDVGAATAIKYATSGTVADAATETTQRLSSIAGSAFNSSFVEFDSNNSLTSRTWADDFTEYEFCLENDSAVVSDVITFRPVLAGGTVPTITNTATATVTATALTLAGAAGSYVLTGQSATLVAQVFAFQKGAFQPQAFQAAEEAASASTLAGDAGSFTLTGQAAGLAATRTIAGAAGSYALTGQAAGLYAARKVVGAAGAYTFTGQAAGLASTRRLVGAAGGFELSGVAAGLAATRLIAGAAGSYTVTGQSAALIFARAGEFVLVGAAGAYALDGQAAGLAATRALAAEAGAYLFTGQAAALEATQVVPEPAGAKKRAPGQPIRVRRFRAIFNGQVVEFETMAALQRAVEAFEAAAREDAKASAADLAEKSPKRRAKTIAERAAPKVALLEADGPDEQALAALMDATNRRIREAFEAELRVQLLILQAKIAAALQADEDDAVAVLLEF
jgi:hypothetical protein